MSVYVLRRLSLAVPTPIGISMLVFAWNLIYSWVIARVPSPENPWQSRGIEWMLPSPVPVENFETIPEIIASPYEYGVPGAVHGVFKEKEPVAAGTAATAGTSE